MKAGDPTKSPRIALPFPKGGRGTTRRRLLLSTLMWLREVGLFNKGLADVWIPRPLPQPEQEEGIGGWKRISPASIFQVPSGFLFCTLKILYSSTCPFQVSSAFWSLVAGETLAVLICVLEIIFPPRGKSGGRDKYRVCRCRCHDDPGLLHEPDTGAARGADVQGVTELDEILQSF